MQTEQRLLNALAIDVIVAWRLHTITMAGRANPELSCGRMRTPGVVHPV